MRDRPLVILTPEHPLWPDFCARLGGEEGCNFQGEGENITWTCKGGTNQDYSRAILQTMADIDVDATLRYFSEQGGHCDCEVLFNVDPDEEVSPVQEVTGGKCRPGRYKEVQVMQDGLGV